MNTTLLILLGFAAFAGLLVYLTVLSSKVAEKKLNDQLGSLGFARCVDQSIKDSLLQHLQIVNTRVPGKRLLLNLYKKSSSQNECDLYFCDYHFASASGRGRGGNAFLVCLISGQLQLPRFTVDSYPEDSPAFISKMFETLSDSLPYPDIKQIDSQLFGLNKNFRVYVAPEQRDQLISIKSEVGSVIADKGGISLDAKGNALILSDIHFKSDMMVKKSLDMQKVSQLVETGAALYDKLKI
ncbi:MAG: hypothetical protein H6754_06940 [Candidatus Omnitrophica bacterium]|nr:hypothetical protein [Candidatus Omnitrophota bacterium]